MFRRVFLSLIFVIAFKMNAAVVNASLHPCEFDLEEICGVPSTPKTQMEIYNARFCLGSNLNLLTNDCSDYVRYEAPSFIERCAVDIQKHCRSNSVTDVQSCIMKHRDDAQVDCQNALNQKYAQSDVLLTWPNHEAVKDYAPELKDPQELVKNDSDKFYLNFLNTYTASASAAAASSKVDKKRKDEEVKNLRGALDEIRGTQELLLKFSKKQT